VNLTPNPPVPYVSHQLHTTRDSMTSC
jgi:hypothetical protein